ncbi:MAG TPA: glycine reductase, partial [Peptococcaceae bacterium]|nr:glycine reductase [Peptococcaceae bacterium]
FEDAVSYPPNQAYIGNITPDQLKEIPHPWYENPLAGASRDGKHGEIMPEDEFFGLMKMVDSFDLVLLEEAFQAGVKGKLESHPILKDIKEINKLESTAHSADEIQKLVDEHDAQPLYFAGKLVGCVKKAHEFDEALSSEVMLGNLASKASSVLVLKQLLAKTDLNPVQVDYIIECSEEACGDMNQRG